MASLALKSPVSTVLIWDSSRHTAPLPGYKFGSSSAMASLPKVD